MYWLEPSTPGLPAKTNDTLIKTIYYIVECYTIDFAELMLEYMTKLCNLFRNSFLRYFNLLHHIFNAFNLALEDEECLDF